MPTKRPRMPQDARSALATAPTTSDAEIVVPVEIDHLTLKQRLFVEAYIGRARGNATEAARLAGYEGDDVTLASCGYANLRKPQIVSELTRRRQELVAQVGAESLILQAKQEADASYEDFIRVEADGTFSFDLVEAKRLGKLHLIEDLSHDKETGAPVVKLPNRQAARAFIAKMLGLGKEAPATGQSNTQINIYQQLATLPTEEIKRLREAQRQSTEGDK